MSILPHTLRIAAWEVTRSCNLACIHCRASSDSGPYEGELDTKEGLRLLDEIALLGSPMVILTGGEPLLRKDIYDLADYGDKKGLRMVLATNGTLVTQQVAKKMTASGIKRASVSIDGFDAASHDAFRGVPGAFAGALAGIEAFRKAGMEFQINTTVTRKNLDQLQKILDLAIQLGAVAHHIFLLVPTGRGKEMADQEIAPGDYERTLDWFYEKNFNCSLQLKATCAPHYFRIAHQRKGKQTSANDKKTDHPLRAMSRGCMAGSSFCFISHVGQVQPCGYLEINCGRIRKESFGEIWQRSPVFHNLRDMSLYKGKCGRCEFIRICGGCRARAYEITGDYLSEEPYCIYEPQNR
jgi:heme b synthase